MTSAHRRCLVLRGAPHDTAARAGELVSALAPADVLWVGSSAPTGVSAVPDTAVRRLLGRSFDAVVLDLHGGLDADVLGQCHGFVRGGGGLVLRMPRVGRAPAGGRERLAVEPFAAEAVGTRLYERLERCLARSPAVADPRPLTPPARAIAGTREQDALVARLARAFVDGRPAFAVVIADRGRGKSAALGRAARAALDRRPGLRIAVTAADPGQAAEVLRFVAGPSGGPPLDPVPYLPPLELARSVAPMDVLLVDEAAQLPVPVLQRLVTQHPGAVIAFATTARGYEGTGRGFVLRFLAWLGDRGRPLTRDTLEAPIRWAAGDPLESLIFDVLCLDAEAAPAEAVRGAAAEPGAVRAVALDRDALAADEGRLRDVFGLLVHAHYRTTPGDLHRLLDAPNLSVHALLYRGRVVGATLLAREGGLSAATCEALGRGDRRIRGHALADTLISHAGRPAAGRLRIVRSVRIATHPALRRLGLARALVDHVHAACDADFFGTVFGATPALVRFRREVGYEVARLGIARGSRTGEPGVVMLRPVTPAATALLASLRADLARDLPVQLALMRETLPIDPDLAWALGVGLPAPAALSDAERRAAVRAVLFGPRPSDTALVALRATLVRHADALDALDPPIRAVVQARLLELHSWEDAARAGGFATTRQAQRAMRRALRAWWCAVEP